jgi:CRP/FNR family nitrogen fixation transcriptional regulator
MKAMIMRAQSSSCSPAALPAPFGRGSPSLDNREFVDLIGYMGTVISFARDVEIYGESEPADYLYEVVSGTVRTYKILVDGRRQVGGFYLPGDIFGLEIGERHAFSAEAISNCKVMVIKHSALRARAETDREVALQLWMLTGRELRRLQDHLLLLIKNAPERLAAFLLAMAGRASDSRLIELTMSRRDIADHLGLTIETVSRSLTQLEKAGAIEFSSRRRIVLHDRSVLERLMM